MTWRWRVERRSAAFFRHRSPPATQRLRAGRADPGFGGANEQVLNRRSANAGRARQGLPPAPVAKVSLSVGRTGPQRRLNSPV